MDASPVTAGEERGDGTYSSDLLNAVVAAIPGWVARVMSTRVDTIVGPDRDTFAAEVERVGREMATRSRDSLTRLFALDVEQQRMNPLQVLRQEASLVTESLRALGAVPRDRDAVDAAFHPDDAFGIGPLAWRDLGDEVHECGITWGAWKAAVIISRHTGDPGTRS